MPNDFKKTWDETGGVAVAEKPTAQPAKQTFQQMWDETPISPALPTPDAQPEQTFQQMWDETPSAPATDRPDVQDVRRMGTGAEPTPSIPTAETRTEEFRPPYAAGYEAVAKYYRRRQLEKEGIAEGWIQPKVQSGELAEDTPENRAKYEEWRQGRIDSYIKQRGKEDVKARLDFQDYIGDPPKSIPKGIKPLTLANAVGRLIDADGDAEKVDKPMYVGSEEWSKAMNYAVPLYKQSEAYSKQPKVKQLRELRAKGQIGIKENFARNWKSLVPFYDVAKGLELKEAFRRLEENEYGKYQYYDEDGRPLNLLQKMGAPFDRKRADRKLAENYLNDIYEERVRTKTWGADASMGLAHTAVWMAEFIATSGAGTLAKMSIKEGAKALIKQSVKSAIKRGVIKMTARLAGWLAVAGTRAILLPHRTIGPYIQESLPKDFEWNKDGSITVTKRGKEGFVAFARAFQGAVISFAAEETGATITRTVTRMPGVRRLAKRTFGKLSAMWEKSPKTMSKYNFITKHLKRGGYSTLPGELGEEQFERVARYATGLGGNVFPTAREFGLELAILSVPAAGRAAVVHGAALLESLGEHKDETDSVGAHKFALSLIEKGIATVDESKMKPKEAEAFWKLVGELQREGVIRRTTDGQYEVVETPETETDAVMQGRAAKIEAAKPEITPEPAAEAETPPSQPAPPTESTPAARTEETPPTEGVEKKVAPEGVEGEITPENTWIATQKKVAESVPLGTPDGAKLRRENRESIYREWVKTPEGRTEVLSWLTTASTFDEQQEHALKIALGEKTPVYRGVYKDAAKLGEKIGVLWSEKPEEVQGALDIYYSKKDKYRNQQLEYEKKRQKEEMVIQQRIPSIRRAIQTTLRKNGYSLEHSDAISNYYQKWLPDENRFDTIRVSDHDVPETLEREYNKEMGRTGWAYKSYLDVRKYATPEDAIAATEEHIGMIETEQPAPAKPEAKPKRIFSKEGYDAAAKRLSEGGQKLYGGIPIPSAQELKDAAFIVMYHVESGVRKLADILKATAGQFDPKMICRAWLATKAARREYAAADRLGKPVSASRVNKLVRDSVEAGIPKVEKKRLVLSIKAWLRGWKRGEIELAEVHSNLVGIVQKNLPLSQHERFAKKIAKAGTAAQLNAVSRQISKAIQKERIAVGAREQRPEAVAEEIITTPAKLLRNVMKREQITSAKAYLAGAKDVVANHAELVEYAEDALGKGQAGKLLKRIAKTRTPRQRQLAVAAIDILADKAEKKAAFNELKVEIKAIDIKKMPDPQAEQIKDLLDTFTLSEPANKTLARARKIFSAAERDNLGEVPQALITRAEMYLERAEKTPVGKLPVESIREITQALITLAHAASTKNQLFSTRKHRNAKEAVATATKEVAERHGAKYQTETGEWSERRIQNLFARIATWDQLSLETKAYMMGGDGSAIYDLLYDALLEGDNRRITTARKSVERIQAKMKELGLKPEDLETYSRPMSRKRAKIQIIELPTATDTKGRRVKSVEMTRAERITLLCHFMDSETRRELLRNRQKGITFARAKGREAIKLRIADIEAIRQSATPTEIALAELGHEICNSDEYLRGSLNEAWHAEFGWKLAKRSDYWHRQRDYEYRKESKDPNVVMQQWIDRMLEQQGRFKKRTRSNDPIVVGDFFIELMTHINRVSAFVGKGRATHDAMRLLQDRGFRNAVRDSYKHGDSLLSDLEKTVKDYRGLDVRPLETIEKATRWMIRRIHIGALGLKPHIVAYQTVSLINASNEILIPPQAAPLALKKSFREEMRKRSQQIWVRHHATAHQILTPGSAAISAEAFYGAREGGIIERASMGAIHEADMAVIYTISAAAHLEGQKKGLTGDALWDYTVHKAEQVIARTQPTWDVLTTSSIHRAARASPLVKLLATMFSSQRNKNLNMMAKAASDYKQGDKTAKNTANAFRKLATPTIVNAFMITGIAYGWNALLGTIGKAVGLRDDEEEKSRSFMGTVVQRFFGNWIVVGDLVAAAYNAAAKGIRGESILFVGRRGDPLHEAANDTIEAIGGMAKAAGEAARKEVRETGEFKSEQKASRTFMRAAEKSARAIGMLTGKPVSGILQIYRGLTGRKRPSNLNRAAKAIAAGEKDKALVATTTVFERWRNHEKTLHPEWSAREVERKITKDMRAALARRSKWKKEKSAEHWAYLVKVDKFLPAHEKDFEYHKTQKVTSIITKHKKGEMTDAEFANKLKRKAAERKDYFAYLKAAGVDKPQAVKLLKTYMNSKDYDTPKWNAALDRLKARWDEFEKKE